ncbi:MAG: hypothetical protein GW917_03410, partial [Bdellovibrionales bacterium]|nr:hypothetical protein [Bdellovibrionales bacterium]
SEITEGLGNAIYSELLYNYGIRSERCLAVIEFPGGFSINVRVAENLMRPSHMFNHLKQNQHKRLKSAVDYYIERETASGRFHAKAGIQNKYQEMLSKLAKNFATVSAQFEAHYVFCWMDWDGDNILCDGSVIDYGSIRRFGMFHHDYQFDDDSRWSTRLTDQKIKARYIVQCFIQAFDYALTGKKRNLNDFAKHRILKQFDQIFAREHARETLKKMGFSKSEQNWLIQHRRKAVDEFTHMFRYFESRITSTKRKRYGDGVSRHALYSMRDFLREFPGHYLESKSVMDFKTFSAICGSPFIASKDKKVGYHFLKQLTKMQDSYLKLTHAVAKKSKKSETSVLKQLKKSAYVFNRSDLITGDGMIHILGKMMQDRKKIGLDEFHINIASLLSQQSNATPSEPEQWPDVIRPLLRIAKDFRYSL